MNTTHARARAAVTAICLSGCFSDQGSSTAGTTAASASTETTSATDDTSTTPTAGSQDGTSQATTTSGSGTSGASTLDTSGDPTGSGTVSASTESSSTTEPLPNTPPVPEITIPAENSGPNDNEYAYDGYDDGLGMWYKDVTVAGMAFDAEDGQLSENSLTWTTDRTDLQGAELGTGGTLSVRLYSNVCEGVQHTIVLEATDSQGESATVSRQIVIWTLC